MKNPDIQFKSLVILLGIFLCCLYAVLHFIQIEVIGNFFWDTLVFDGIAYAINEGLVPSKDFTATMIFPFYMRYWAEQLSFGAFTENIESWLYIVISTLIALPLLKGKYTNKQILFILVSLALLLAFRANYAHISSRTGLLAHAGSYNRFLDTLLFITLLSMAPFSQPVNKSNRIFEIIAYSFILIFSYYTKISGFMVLSTLIFSIVLANKYYKLTDIIIIFALFLLTWITLNTTLNIGSEYHAFLSKLGQYKSTTIIPQLKNFRLIALATKNGFEIVLYIVATFLLFTAWYKNQQLNPLLNTNYRIKPIYYLSTIWVIASGGILLFTLTNYGDLGFFPLLGFLVAAYMFSDTNYKNTPLTRRYRIVTVLFFAIFALNFIVYSSTYIYEHFWVKRISVNTAIERLNLPNNSIPYLDHVSTREKNITGSPFSLTKGLKKGYKEKGFLSYLILLNHAHTELKKLNIKQEQSVYLFDFPSYILAKWGQYRIPKYTYPFLLWEHEIHSSFHPDETVFFSDIDILVLTKNLSLSKKNKQLNLFYQNTINAKFDVLYQDDLLIIYRKKAIL